MFQSPLKTVAEKIKPVDSKLSVSSLRFERSSDFKKFIRFIKDETKELEKIKLPSATEIKPKSKGSGALGLLGLGLFGLLGSAFGGEGDEKDDKFRIGGTSAGSIVSVPPIGLGTVMRKTPVRLTTKGGVGTLKTTSKQTKTQAQDEAYIKKQKKERQKFIKNRVKQYTKRFNEEFIMISEVEIEDLKLTYGDKLSYVDLEKKFLQERQINPDTKMPYKSLKEKLIRETKRFLMDLDGLEDPRDLKFQKETMMNLKIDQLLNQIDEPLTMDDINLLKKLVTDTDPSNKDALEALEILRSPEAQSIIKEDKFRKITGNTTPKATTFSKGKFTFTPKYALDDLFTGIGEKTKGFRDFISRPFTKGQKPTGLGKALMPGMTKVGSLLRVGGIGLDVLSAGLAAYELYDGFVVGDNILTSFYDLGVAFNNIFEPDKTKLKFFITKSRNKEKNAFIDKKNQKVLEAIQKAQAAKGISDQVLANTRDQQRGGIIPSVKAATNNPFGITLAPAVFGIKFISEKLYRQ